MSEPRASRGREKKDGACHLPSATHRSPDGLVSSISTKIIWIVTMNRECCFQLLTLAVFDRHATGDCRPREQRLAIPRRGLRLAILKQGHQNACAGCVLDVPAQLRRR